MMMSQRETSDGACLYFKKCVVAVVVSLVPFFHVPTTAINDEATF